MVWKMASLRDGASSENAGGCGSKVACGKMDLNTADPLNLVGVIVPGERVPAISGKFVTYRDGVAVPNEAPKGLHAVTGD